jgi:hypothetical protein
MKLTPHLTSGYAPELAAQIRQSHPGMAYFAATGSFGATCGECDHLGYYAQRRNAAGEIVNTTRAKGCAKFHALTGKHGPAVPASAAACKYFERRES